MLPSTVTLPPLIQEVVTCVGQPIGVVVAETEAQARAAALAVGVQYEPLPVLLDIQGAITAGSYYEVRSREGASPHAPTEAAAGTRAARRRISGRQAPA